jgi:hypothetical protein
LRNLTLANFGHIVGQIVKEFLDQVLPNIIENEPAKFKNHFNGSKIQLISLFRTLVYQSDKCKATLAVTADILSFVQSIKDNCKIFKLKNENLWNLNSQHIKQFKNLTEADNIWTNFIFDLFIRISEHLLANTSQWELYI